MTINKEQCEVCLKDDISSEEQEIEIVEVDGGYSGHACHKHIEEMREILFEARDFDRHLDNDDEYHLIDGVGFADPGGTSALRAETK